MEIVLSSWHRNEIISISFVYQNRDVGYHFLRYLLRSSMASRLQCTNHFGMANVWVVKVSRKNIVMLQISHANHIHCEYMLKLKFACDNI